MKARAVAKYIKGSPQKARLVIDLIRGRNVNEAPAMLPPTNQRGAGAIGDKRRQAQRGGEGGAANVPRRGGPLEGLEGDGSPGPDEFPPPREARADGPRLPR